MDSLTEHDRRHERLQAYVARAEDDQREVAKLIRPHLEKYLRVALPEQFPPGTLLGSFLGLCRQRRGQPDEILDQAAIEELAGLVEYANRFHHDTNPALGTEAINDVELRGFVEAVVGFRETVSGG